MSKQKGNSTPTDGWAKEGWTEITPADPSPSLGDSDILRSGANKGPRDQCAPGQYEQRNKFQQGGMERLRIPDKDL